MQSPLVEDRRRSSPTAGGIAWVLCNGPGAPPRARWNTPPPATAENRVPAHRLARCRLDVSLRMFEHLDKIPWHALAHAYGPATDATKWIPALASDDENLRSEAVYGFLHSSICHQYTTYSATPHVIPFVVEALRDPTVS